MSGLRVGSLFSGIGGLDLGLERAGMEVIWQAEIDPYASRVLAKHWPDIPNLGDVTSIDWSTVERPDLICGGYPCQPFSFAGARAGTSDRRHLWPYFADALRHLRPEWAVLENVPGHLGLGFDAVLADLAELGMDAEWELFPAAAVGAPHLRYRLLVVAHANGGCGDRVSADAGDGRAVLEEGPIGIFRRGGGGSHLADPDGASRWAPEPAVGRMADGVPDRVDRLRALGNAVVPQVAEYVGRSIIDAIGAAR